MINSLLDSASGRIDARLDTIFCGVERGELKDAMRYALRGGKRLRGFLAFESAKLYSVDEASGERTATAIECMHAYSLVHDDLPCMDNDELRRGRPTVHVKWGEAMAVLVGDALQAMSFEILSDAETSPDAGIRIALVQSLARASGANGMVLGQHLDCNVEKAGHRLGMADIARLQSFKTGALMVWACQSGAILAGSNPEPLRTFAKSVGLAFQIADDLLDVTGDESRVGKRVRKDADAGKATFVAELGEIGARLRAHELVDQACTALDPFGSRADALQSVARFVVNRDH